VDIRGVEGEQDGDRRWYAGFREPVVRPGTVRVELGDAMLVDHERSMIIAVVSPGLDAIRT
jgi:hypothetical protein